MFALEPYHGTTPSRGITLEKTPRKQQRDRSSLISPTPTSSDATAGVQPHSTRDERAAMHEDTLANSKKPIFCRSPQSGSGAVLWRRAEVEASLAVVVHKVVYTIGSIPTLSMCALATFSVPRFAQVALNWGKREKRRLRGRSLGKVQACDGTPKREIS